MEHKTSKKTVYIRAFKLYKFQALIFQIMRELRDTASQMTDTNESYHHSSNFCYINIIELNILKKYMPPI
jgi:hypothetical protein